MQMGARLYNSETGRFMSVDPLFETFTEHSPYHYGYNNPVMYNDPSGLAPNDEKRNRTMASGVAYMGSSITAGFYVSKSVDISIKVGKDSPLAPGERIKETHTYLEYILPSAGGGSSRSGGFTAGAGLSSSGSVATPVPNSELGLYSARKGVSNNHLQYNANKTRSQVQQSAMRNTLYVNMGGAEALESNFFVKLNLKKTEFFDLYEVTGFSGTHHTVGFDFFYSKLSEMINNGIQPIALSTNQAMNKNKQHKNVRTIENSLYGIETAFVSEVDIEYIDLNYARVKFSLGQIIAHEFFGHVFHALFGNHYPWYSSWLVGNEIPAMEVENYYLFINGLPQRNHYNINSNRGSIWDWLWLKSYP